jgi:hypothetical protein
LLFADIAYLGRYLWLVLVSSGCTQETNDAILFLAVLSELVAKHWSGRLLSDFCEHLAGHLIDALIVQHLSFDPELLDCQQKVSVVNLILIA